MPKFADQRVLPFRRRDLFKLVGDVGSYPEFLPWCVGARILNTSENQFDADLLIGFKMFRERFRSRVKFVPETSISIDYIEGPMKYLHNEWHFSDAKQGTELKFNVDFEFKNKLLELMIGSMFEEAAHKMISAFEARAHDRLKVVQP